MVKTNFGEVMSEKFIYAVKLYLTNSFGNLTLKTSPVYPNSVFYVDSFNNVLIEYNKINEDVHIHYNQIWAKLELLFSLNYVYIQFIMENWLEEHYKLVNLKRCASSFRWKGSWRNITNWLI
jgi:hypothetical protein